MKIVHYPHPSLRHRAVPLTAIDKKVRLAAGEMLEMMYASKGLGLAAPQVALPYQMFVMNAFQDNEGLHREKEAVLINPVIMEKKGSIEGDEGCLSFPELYLKVRRAKTVQVHAYTLEGQAIEINSTQDLESRLLQHEWDHLQGGLFIDKIGPIGKLAARGYLREFERLYRKAQEKGEIAANPEIVDLLKKLELEA